MKRTMPVRLLTRYIRDAQFRSLAGIYIGLTVDILYAAFRAIVGLRYGSRWFLSMAVYYAVLGMLRAYLIFGMRRAAPLGSSERLYYEYSCYRRTGFMLLALNAAMGAMISLMVIANLRYNYPGYIIYLSALHAFYMFISAIVNLAKSRRFGMPILSAARAVNLVAAMMSMLGLQTALIARFSPDTEMYPRRMNAITGGVIYIGVIAMAIYMLRHAYAMQRRIQSGEE